MYVSTKIHVAKIVQTEGRTSSLLECYTEVQPIFCKDTQKNVSVYVFNNYYCSNAYLFEKESVTLHPHTQQ